MNDVMEMKLKGQHVYGAKPEYFLDLAVGHHKVKGWLAIYEVIIPNAPEPIAVKRVWACHRKSNEMLLLADFWMN